MLQSINVNIVPNIYSKLGVHSRTEAAVAALQQGWAHVLEEA